MAFTVTRIHNTVFGDRRAFFLEVTADANSGVIDPGGIGHVTAIGGFAPISMSSASEPKLKRNLNAASAASQGMIMASGFTNGDAFTCVVYGR